MYLGEQPMFESTIQPVDKLLVAPNSPTRNFHVSEREGELGAALDFTLDVPLKSVQEVNGAGAVLAAWYASHPVVRRLWAIDGSEALRVVLTLEPTVDGDDTQPTWLANSWSWARELRVQFPRDVHLELIADPSNFDPSPDGKTALITEIYWRDPTA
jgi:hypothetical protein